MGAKQWQYRQYNRKSAPFLWIIVFLSSLITIISINVLITFVQYPQPQAILSLGGGMDRVELTSKLAAKKTQLTIWISSGSDSKLITKLFIEQGIAPDRYFLDNQATDTVTNFTTLVDDFRQHHIKHLYLITSDFHMPRARAIGTIVLGSRGIVFTPMEVRTNMEVRTKRARESTIKTLRDVCRSILWVFSGYTGASLKGI